MDGTARIFAREFQESCLPLAGTKEGVVSPSGLTCHRIFVAGALVELVQKGPDLWIGRVADPTGVFEFRTEKPDSLLKIALQEQSTPSFVTVVCRVNYGTGDPPGSSLVLLEIRQADRTVRDIWVMRTAELMLDRLSRLQKAVRPGSHDAVLAAVISHYHTNDDDLKDLVGMVAEALNAIEKPATGGLTDQVVRDRVLEYIRENAGKSGISFEAISAAAGEWGVDSARVREAVKALAEEDECYQPSVGVFKPL